MKNNYELYTKEELISEIRALKDSKKYGLVWEDYAEKADLITNPNFELSDEFSFGSETSDNPIKHEVFEGDNLLALKHLEKTHLGKIDVIYIDPPYNTGNEFVYNDKIVDKEDNFRHSKWLSFMDKRLRLAKNLMTDDGVIFVSIDDNEQAQLKLLMDEIFGEQNFIENFFWERTTHFGRQAKNTYVNAEYILCYSKNLYNNKGDMKRVLVDSIQEVFEDAPLYNNSNNLQLLNFKANTVKFNIPDGVYCKFDGVKYSLLDNVEVENGTNINDFRMKFRSRWGQLKLDEQNNLGGYSLVKTTQFAIRYVYGDREPHYKSVLKTLNTSYGNNQDASKLLNNIIGEGIFDYPKPITLVKYLLSTIYFENNKDITVLDFFAGSGTTGHAVMELNKEDGGNRKFILCTNNEVSEEKVRQHFINQGLLDKNTKTAFTKFRQENEKLVNEFYETEEYQKLGIARSVTYERLKRVIEGYTTPKGKFVEGLKGNRFDYFIASSKI